MPAHIIMPPVSRVIYTIPPPSVFINARDAPGPPNCPLPPTPPTRPPTRPRPRPAPPVPRPDTTTSVVLQPATISKPVTILRPVTAVGAGVGVGVVNMVQGQPLVPVVNVPLNSRRGPDAVLLRRVS
ncbi:hypothetical protein ABKA04_007861 [Annulohypoxylon sp. FPYF3050]